MLGTAVGYFTDTDVQKFAETTYTDTQYDLDEIVGELGYIFDSEWLMLLSTSRWPRFVPIARPSAELEIEHLSRAFESCLATWFEISRSVSATAAVAGLNFSPSNDLFAYLDVELQPDDLAEALAANGELSSISGTINGTGLLAGSVYAGYGEIIEFLDVFRTLLNRYRSLYGPAIEGMMRKIAQLMRWRFFFFQSRTVFLSAFIEKYLDILQISSTDTRDGFRRYVQQVTDDWAGYQARLGAQAGA